MPRVETTTHMFRLKRHSAGRSLAASEHLGMSWSSPCRLMGVHVRLPVSLDRTREIRFHARVDGVRVGPSSLVTDEIERSSFVHRFGVLIPAGKKLTIHFDDSTPGAGVLRVRVAVRWP